MSSPLSHRRKKTRTHRRVAKEEPRPTDDDSLSLPSERSFQKNCSDPLSSSSEIRKEALLREAAIPERAKMMIPSDGIFLLMQILQCGQLSGRMEKGGHFIPVERAQRLVNTPATIINYSFRSLPLNIA